MSKILIVNITWNPFGWKNNNYINPKAGHDYARKNVGGESLNFKFNKKNIDTDKFIYGYVQWTKPPINFEKDGLILFYTQNTEIRKGQIVGIYSKAEIYNDSLSFNVPFQENDYWVNLKAEKEYSLLFPYPLSADLYKKKSSDRIVGQIGFSYKDEQFAEKVLFDELTEMSNSGTSEQDFQKLVKIYEYYTSKKYIKPYFSQDEIEQQELEKLFNSKSKKELIEELNKLTTQEPEEVIIKHKTYKRDNKTIAQIKLVRNYQCQICKTSILKKDGKFYVEAAHIQPKSKKGCETPENIILLCPNHHKEFDFGKVEILTHDKNTLEFIMNDIKYKINLELKM